MLDPSATLSINDWLINLRAAAGSEFRMCFLTAADLEQTFRNTSGMTRLRYPDFTSIKVGYEEWLEAINFAALSTVLYGWIMNNVSWQKDRPGAQAQSQRHG